MKRYSVSIIVILIFFLIFFLRGENIFYIILKPTQRLFYKSGETSSDEDICRQLKIENVQLKTIQTENEILKKHLDFLSKSKDRFVLANIIGRRTEAGTIWFLLDQGANQGIKSDLAVLDENGILLGTIIKVEKNISYLRPIFDRRSSLAADIISQELIMKIGPEDSSNKPKIISGIIQGEYGSNLKMKYVPLDKEIKIGDGVITTGQEDGIRWGIIIGQVAEVNKKPNAIFQEVLIEPLSQTNFRIVSVILSP